MMLTTVDIFFRAVPYLPGIESCPQKLCLFSYKISVLDTWSGKEEITQGIALHSVGVRNNSRAEMCFVDFEL